MISFRLTETARATRKELPSEAQNALWDVEELLCANPRQGRRLDDDSDVWDYWYPDHNLRITYRFNEEKDVIELIHFDVAVVVDTREVFISYSHDDRSWFEILRGRLGALEVFGFRFWDDKRIEAAQDWELEIGKRLESARGALLLVSASFLASEFIRTTELPAFLDAAAEKGGKSRFKLLWFLVSSCDLDADALAKRLSRYQALLDPKKPLDRVRKERRDKVLNQMVEKIARAVKN